MKLLSNILLASVALSVLILIVVCYLFNNYDIEFKEYVRLFLYVVPTITLFMAYHKRLLGHNYEPMSAAAEVFNEITDSQQLNGIMPLHSILGGKDDELIIDNIPKSITCNNIV